MTAPLTFMAMPPPPPQCGAAAGARCGGACEAATQGLFSETVALTLPASPRSSWGAPMLAEATVREHQSDKSASGRSFEVRFAAALTAAGRPFYREVPMLHDGTLLLLPPPPPSSAAQGGSRKRRHENAANALTFLDFVVPLGWGAPTPPTHVSQVLYASLKRSCRERWLEDSWTLHMRPQPLAYLLVCETTDFPSAARFGETPRRRIVAPLGKRADARAYAHVLADLPSLLDELDAAICLAQLRDDHATTRAAPP